MRPLIEEPGDKVPLVGFRAASLLNGTQIVLGRLVAKPLVPMPADSEERTSQKRAVAVALLAPVPKCPKPDKAHCALPSKLRPINDCPRPSEGLTEKAFGPLPSVAPRFAKLRPAILHQRGIRYQTTK